MMNQLVQQMQVMPKQMEIMQTSNGKGGAKTGDGKQKSENDNETINPQTGKLWKRYCWSYGCVTHWGKNYPNKKGS